jgi:hypothetical protein
VTIVGSSAGSAALIAKWLGRDDPVELAQFEAPQASTSSSIVNVNSSNSTPITVTIVGNPSPPAPTFWDPTPFSALVGLADTAIIDMTAFFAKVVSWTLSNPAGNPAIWIAYGSPASVGAGIYLPPDGFLYEDTYFGFIHGISVGPGTAPVGGQVLQTP